MRLRLSKLTLWAMAILLAGCAPAPWASLPQPRPLGADLGTYAPVADSASRDTAPHIDEPTGVLTLRQALVLSLAKNPELSAFAWSVRQAEAQQLQASLLPNPRLEAEFENFAGSGEFGGTQSAESTIALGQLIELGGKRRKRMRLAQLEGRLTGWDYEAKRLEVLTLVYQRFTRMLAVQERHTLVQESLRLAQEMLSAVEKRVETGKTPPTELSKAAVEVATSRIRVQRIERELAAGRHMLAATWGSSAPMFDSVAGDLSQIHPIPPLDRLIPLLAQNPEIARGETQIDQTLAQLALEKARAIPDIKAGVGYKQSRETENNDHALVAGVSVPLSIFNRNQGNISKARSGVQKARMERRAAEVEIWAALQESYQKLAATYEEATALRDEVLPAAQRSFDASSRSFREGKANYLDVLDAQRTLTETREQQVEALAAYHQARAEVEALIGQPLEVNTSGRPEGKDTNNED